MHVKFLTLPLLKSLFTTILTRRFSQTDGTKQRILIEITASALNISDTDTIWRPFPSALSISVDVRIFYSRMSVVQKQKRHWQCNMEAAHRSVFRCSGYESIEISHQIKWQLQACYWMKITRGIIIFVQDFIQNLGNDHPDSKSDTQWNWNNW